MNLWDLSEAFGERLPEQEHPLAHALNAADSDASALATLESMAAEMAREATEGEAQLLGPQHDALADALMPLEATSSQSAEADALAMLESMANDMVPSAAAVVSKLQGAHGTQSHRTALEESLALLHSEPDGSLFSSALPDAAEIQTGLDPDDLLAILHHPEAMHPPELADGASTPLRPDSPDALASQLGSSMQLDSLGGGGAPLAMSAGPPSAASVRSLAERKEWTAAEDELIRSGVAAFGCKWRRIAAQLPGRSDDAVRNRWHRLQAAASGVAEERVSQRAEGTAPPTGKLSAVKRRGSVGGRQAAAAAGGGGAPHGEGGARPERLSWTPHEDRTILSSVDELGHKWNKIALRLPGRTEHAIRNRHHRLQTAILDAQRKEQQQQEQWLPPPAAAPSNFSFMMSVGA